ncbi:ChaN family lipoprotein (plasmid) [Ensifer sp. PDNC004]|nr:ChaN family lipoprotein [Ensifer sp. PDNC004]
MAGKSAVLLGENHDRYDIHRWQLHVLAGLHAQRTDVVVGFEMFPRRVRPRPPRIWARHAVPARRSRHPRCRRVAAKRYGNRSPGRGADRRRPV